MNGKASTKHMAIDAVVYPVCECGKPWKEHGACGGYRPTGPVKDYGTIWFQSPSLLANALFRLERLIRTARLKLSR